MSVKSTSRDLGATTGAPVWRGVSARDSDRWLVSARQIEDCVSIAQPTLCQLQSRLRPYHRNTESLDNSRRRNLCRADLLTEAVSASYATLGRRDAALTTSVPHRCPVARQVGWWFSQFLCAPEPSPARFAAYSLASLHRHATEQPTDTPGTVHADDCPSSMASRPTARCGQGLRSHSRRTKHVRQRLQYSGACIRDSSTIHR